MSDATNNRFYRQPSPSESTEQLTKEGFLEYFATEAYLAGRNNLPDVVSNYAKDQLDELLDQEYSKGVSDALAALPEPDNHIEVCAAVAAWNAQEAYVEDGNYQKIYVGKDPLEVFEYLCDCGANKVNQALNEARSNIEKLKEQK